jgi:hypothetical protein
MSACGVLACARRRGRSLEERRLRIADEAEDCGGILDAFEGRSGLEWHDSCLKFREVDRPVRTASVLQVRQPIYRTSVGLWRPTGPAMAALLEGLGPELAGAC